jgi:hypothetical protein
VHALEPAGLEYPLVLIFRRELVCGDGRHGRAEAVAGNVNGFQLALGGVVQVRMATGEGRVCLTQTVEDRSPLRPRRAPESFDDIEPCGSLIAIEAAVDAPSEGRVLLRGHEDRIDVGVRRPGREVERIRSAVSEEDDPAARTLDEKRRRGDKHRVIFDGDGPAGVVLEAHARHDCRDHPASTAQT